MLGPPKNGLRKVDLDTWHATRRGVVDAWNPEHNDVLTLKQVLEDSAPLLKSRTEVRRRSFLYRRLLYRVMWFMSGWMAFGLLAAFGISFLHIFCHL